MSHFLSKSILFHPVKHYYSVLTVLVPSGWLVTHQPTPAITIGNTSVELTILLKAELGLHVSSTFEGCHYLAW